MTADFISLLIIALIAAICPLIAQLIPNKLIPESVFLLVAGALLGPHLAGAIALSDVVSFMSDLGLAFLFLLAGMEIDPKGIVGHEGKRGIAAWAASLIIALILIHVLPWFHAVNMDSVAVAIAMTTTAFGTLVPIMKERGLFGTAVGQSITAYGTWGELGPVLAIAVLLSTRSSWQTIIILVAIAALALVMAIVPTKARDAGSRIYRFLTEKANTTYQTLVRMTVLILITLVAVSAIFDLDIVLGAFAAGFVIRYIMPKDNHTLELKLNGMGYGFFIPIFFVVSGAKIDLSAVGSAPGLLIAFIIALLLVRGLPIFISLSTDRQCELSIHKRWTVTFYCTTALPIIVAVTSIATSAGTMAQDTASVLVAAGAVSVFLMPLLASLTYRVADAEPVAAAREIASTPKDLRAILHEHALIEKSNALQAKLSELDMLIAREEKHGKEPGKKQLERRERLKTAAEKARQAAARARENL